MVKCVFILSFFLVISAGAQSQPNESNGKESFKAMHLGMFVHYMHPAKQYQWGATEWADGSAVKSLNELADNLDVEDFANVAASMRAQYVIFTTWHANMNALYPSEVIKEMLPGHCSERDVIRDLVEALKSKGIKLVLYIHPSDAGPDFTKEDQDRTGWNDGPPYRKWNDFINDVVVEIIERYGDDLSGFYVDGGLPVQVDAPRLRKTILDGMPNAWIIQNSGLNSECADYAAHERMVEPYPAAAWLRCQTITSEWWAKKATVSFCPELAYRYTILQAAVKDRMGGGVSWSFGPHPGGRWELGVRSFSERLGQLIDKAGASLFETVPSKAYITLDQTPLIGLPFVATESADGKKTFIHVFCPPKSRSIKLPVPADGRRFSFAKIMNGERIKLDQDDSGVTLTVDSPGLWDDIDTIVELR